MGLYRSRTLTISTDLAVRQLRSALYVSGRSLRRNRADKAATDLLFGAVPIVYEEGRGWNTLVGSLPFIATLLGCLTGASINLAYGTQYYIKKVDAANGPVPPELRCAIGGSYKGSSSLLVNTGSRLWR